MTEDHSKHSDCAWPDEPCNQLTFAQAMALEPSEVEVMSLQGTWLTVDGDPLCWTMAHLRKAKFRRARPKRSRVQEMAESGQCGRSNTDVMSAAIRAVCESIRNTPRGFKCHDCALADDIEREFLEPR